MTSKADRLEPIRKGVSVSWDQDSAFKRFTAHFAQWWPYHELSIGGRRIREVVFECKQGGRIYEVHVDGTRFKWGNVLEWDPPRRMVLAWHSSRAESDAQHVEITFKAEPTGTRVELVSSGWEKLGDEARKGYGGYAMAWRVVLEIFSERRSLLYLVFWLFGFLLDKTKGRQAFVTNALGRMD